MTRDREAHEFAALKAWRAYESWEPGHAPLKRYIAVCVKRGIWEYWRRKARRHEEARSNLWWAEVYKDRYGKVSSPYDADDFEQRPKYTTFAELPSEGEFLELPNGSLVSRAEWDTLWAHFVEKLPYDVIARRAGCDGSFSQLKKAGLRLVRAALSEVE